MSVTAVLDRIGQLETMIASAAGPQASGGAMAPTAFASALATATGSASATSGTTAVAASTATAGAAGSSALPAGTPYGAEITAAASRNGLDPALLAGLVKQESGFNANAVSSAGARGLTQLMPATAAGLGVGDVTDPAQALEGGAKYLKAQLDRFGGDVAKALAAYNAGPGAVERFGGVPPYAETQAYVRRVEAYAAAFRSQPTSV